MLKFNVFWIAALTGVLLAGCGCAGSQGETPVAIPAVATEKAPSKNIRLAAVSIDKMLYRPGEVITVSAAVENVSAEPLVVTAKLIRESDLNRREVVAEKEFTLAPGKSAIALNDTAKEEYGYCYVIELAEKDCAPLAASDLCEVYFVANKFVRIIVLCPDAGMYPSFPEEKVISRVADLKKNRCNVLEFFEWGEFFNLMPQGAEWMHPRWKHDISKRRASEIEKFRISEKKIAEWRRETKKNGILLISYDECACAHKDIWEKSGRIYNAQTGKVIRNFYLWDDIYAPNCDKAAPLYADVMLNTTKRFDWDGNFHDSFVGWSRRTANAVDEYGDPATKLTYDQVQGQWVRLINEKVLPLKPYFLHVLNGMPGEASTLPHEVYGANLSIDNRKALKEKILATRDTFDPDTAKQKNCVWMSEVVTSSPANRRYETFGLLHQSARQFCRQGISNSFISYHKWSREEDFAPIMALYYANGMGTFASLQLAEKTLPVYRNYTDFAIRYAKYLFDLNLAWVDENDISCSDPALYYQDVAFSRDNGDGEIDYCVNLLNFAADHNILAPHEKPAVRENVKITLKVKANLKEFSAFAGSPDVAADNMVKLDVKKLGNDTIEVVVPRVEYWTLLVIQAK